MHSMDEKVMITSSLAERSSQQSSIKASGLCPAVAAGDGIWGEHENLAAFCGPFPV